LKYEYQWVKGGIGEYRDRMVFIAAALESDEDKVLKISEYKIIDEVTAQKEEQITTVEKEEQITIVAKIKINTKEFSINYGRSKQGQDLKENVTYIKPLETIKTSTDLSVLIYI